MLKFLFTIIFSFVCVFNASADELKSWIITPSVYNGAAGPITCHDGGKFWDTTGFIQPSNGPIRIKRTDIELTGAAGMAGDYAARIWYTDANGTTLFREAYGSTVYWQGGSQSTHHRFEYTPDWITLPVGGQIFLRFECGFFSQLGAPSSQDNHAVYPQLTVYYTLSQ